MIALIIACIIYTPQVGTIWGGEHIEIEITDRGATIEFDCAQGAIDGALAPDSNGHFEIAGTFTPERGPVREGTSQTLKATYSGAIKDDAMTLAVTIARNDGPAPTYELIRGRAGHVRKCR